MDYMFLAKSSGDWPYIILFGALSGLGIAGIAGVMFFMAKMLSRAGLIVIPFACGLVIACALSAPDKGLDSRFMKIVVIGMAVGAGIAGTLSCELLAAISKLEAQVMNKTINEPDNKSKKSTVASEKQVVKRCPSCKQEYRSDIKKCSECDVLLEEDKSTL